jgi:hypothetical protein
MRYVVSVLLFTAFSVAADHACVILRNYPRKTADAFTRWTVPPPYQYVEGDFPKGFKFRSEIRDKHVRKIQELGGKVVIIPSDYQPSDLDDARKRCTQ